MGTHMEPSPSPSLSPLLLLPFLPLPLEVGPLIAARGSGGALKLPQRSPAAKRALVNFRLKIAPLVAVVLRSFSGNATYVIGHKRL